MADVAYLSTVRIARLKYINSLYFFALNFPHLIRSYKQNGSRFLRLRHDKTHGPLFEVPQSSARFAIFVLIATSIRTINPLFCHKTATIFNRFLAILM